MTPEQRKEAISREFLRILANMHGYKTTEYSLDHGVDMSICPVTQRIEPGGATRYLDSQFKLDFQIKSTTSAGVIDGADEIRYDLEAKTYNDLVQRRTEMLPLHLVIVVLDASPPACVAMENTKMSVLGTAFWYLPELAEVPTPNVESKRITIPKANRLGPDFVRDCYQRLEIEI